MNVRHAWSGPASAILLFALLITPAAAQQPLEPPGEMPPAAARNAPVAVPASEIARQATSVIIHVRDLGRQLSPGASQIQIEKELPGLVAEIADYRMADVNRSADLAPRKLLDDTRQQWLRFDATLQRWSRSLDARAGEVGGIIDELTQLVEIWRLTAAAAADAVLPAAVQDQVRQVRAVLADVGGQARDRQGALLTLQNLVSEQRIFISARLEELGAELDDRRDDLLHSIVGPIWRPSRSVDGSLAIGRDLASTFERIAAGVAEFWREYRKVLTLQILAVLLLAALMWSLGHRVEAGDDPEAGVAVAKAILRRPISASGLLAIVTSTWLLYAEAPLVIHSFIPIAALPFAAWVAPAFVPPERRRLIYWTLVLAFLVNCQSVIVAVGLLRQVVLASIAIVGLAALMRFRARVRREDPVVWPRISRVALRLGAFSFVVTLVAAILGYLPLGELLINATVESAYSAFLLLAGFRIVDALLVLALRTPTLRNLYVVQLRGEAIRDRILQFVRIVGFAYWLWTLLDRLSILESTVDWVTRTLSAVLVLGTLRISMGSIILFFVVLWFSLLVARIVRNLLEDDILPRASVPRGRGHAVSMLVNYCVVGIGFLMALAAAGFRVEQFAIIGGALGVGIGFGLQNVVSNFVSGLILVFERPVQVGDTVEVGPLVGTVRRIGIRSSTLRTFDEAEVIVPNSDLISSHVVNWTLSDQLRRMEVKVGVAYGTDPLQVQELLVTVAKAHAMVLDYPSPYSLFKGFGDSSLDFVVRFWTSDFGNWIFIASDVTVGIEKALGEAGITIPFPQRDVHISAVDPPAPIPRGGRPAPSACGEEERPLQVDGDE